VDQILGGLHEQLSAIPKDCSPDAFRQKAMQIIRDEIGFQIREVLVMDEAERLLEEPAKKQIDKEIADALSEMIARAGSRERLRQKFLREGTTLDEALTAHRRGLTVQTYLQHKFYPAVIITRRMLWDYYRQHEDQFRREKRVQMQVLAAPYDRFLPATGLDSGDAEKQLARREAEQAIASALAELQAGADFTDLVKKYSRGPRAHRDGIWPLMARGNKAEENVEAAAFALDEGEISGRIEEAGRGVYLVRALKVQPGQKVSFEDAQEKIAEELKREQFTKLRVEYLDKIYKSATIVVPQFFYLLAVQRAEQRYRP
jgi:parvulin-like peptidyl-prolyl isomerase